MKISELPTGAPGNNDYLPIDNGTTNRKTKISEFNLSGNNVSFPSEDTETPSVWQSVPVLASGTLATLFGRVSTMFANTRHIWNTIGNTALGTSARTISGAIAELVNKIGNVGMGTTATTITGAIAEHTQRLSSEALLSALAGLLHRGSISNFNETTTSGLYSFTSSATNKPPIDAGGMAIVIRSSDTYIYQIAFINRGSATPAPTIYIRRTYAAGSWQAWYLVSVSAT